MKGKKGLKIGNRNIIFKFDLNALESFTEEAGVDLSGIDQALTKVSNIKIFIKALSVNAWSIPLRSTPASSGKDICRAPAGALQISGGNIQTPKA